MTLSFDISETRRSVARLLDLILKFEETHQDAIESVQPHYRESARNLIHYLALRTHDLRNLQRDLSSMAISSIGHSEGYTKGNLQNILLLLRLLEGEAISDPLTQMNHRLTYQRSRERLEEHATDLLGDCTRSRCTQIMVTLPTEAADDPVFLMDLLTSGMNIARINTSHDNQAVWQRMVDNLESAKQTTGLPCRLYMDVAGPKLRTGSVAAGEGLPKKKKKSKAPFILLTKGDRMELVGVPIEGYNATYNEKGELIRPARISVSMPEIFADVEEGQPIAFDDGKISGIIRRIQGEWMEVEIVHAGLGGSKLRADKGINLPATRLSLPSLTERDYDSLAFIAQHADMVGYSFVRRPEDVVRLQSALEKLNRTDLGIILKIETEEAFQNLPRLLLQAMKSPRVGVMIARGDLAVELGFQRISEVQEEILWICEAAHIPNIWATQVLEKLAKKGVATRAEITDAAMSARSECVMLNKGPYILDTVRTLRNIIDRMSSHQFKRRNRLRPLHVAQTFWEEKTDRVLEE
jgi:pyruvate kinase